MCFLAKLILGFKGERKRLTKAAKLSLQFLLKSSPKLSPGKLPCGQIFLLFLMSSLGVSGPATVEYGKLFYNIRIVHFSTSNFVPMSSHKTASLYSAFVLVVARLASNGRPSGRYLVHIYESSAWKSKVHSPLSFLYNLYKGYRSVQLEQIPAAFFFN